MRYKVRYPLPEGEIVDGSNEVYRIGLDRAEADRFAAEHHGVVEEDPHSWEPGNTKGAHGVPWTHRKLGRWN